MRTRLPRRHTHSLHVSCVLETHHHSNLLTDLTQVEPPLPRLNLQEPTMAHPQQRFKVLHRRRHEGLPIQPRPPQQQGHLHHP